MLIALDTETHLITPGNLMPKPVCLSLAQPCAVLGVTTALHTVATDALAVFSRLIRDPAAVLVGHNIAFDLAVLAKHGNLWDEVFAAYDAKRVKDTKIRQELLDIAAGRVNAGGGVMRWDGARYVPVKYSLADLEKRLLGWDRSEQKHGPDVWRLRYAELEDVPLELWPAEARDYALADAEGTLRCYQQQGDAVPDEDEQCRAAWALHLTSARGMAVDKDATDVLEARMMQEREKNRRRLVKAGFVVPRKLMPSELKDRTSKDGKVTRAKTPEFWQDGKPYTYARKMDVIRAYVQRVHARRKRAVPTTEKGEIATDKDCLMQSGSRLLMLLSEEGGVEKILNTYIPVLKAGADSGVSSSYNVLVNSGRCSCVAEGTMIDVVRNLSENPLGIPVEAVKPGDLVYGYDEHMRLGLGKVSWAGMTGHKEVIRLHWRGTGNKKTGFVDLTPEHLVLKTSGEFVRADSLRLYDSVAALSRSTTRSGSRIWATGDAEMREHVFINEQLTGQQYECVHHIDFDALNNTPENLIGMTLSEHSQGHALAMTDAIRESIGKKISARHRAGLYSYASGIDKPNTLRFDKNWFDEKLPKYAFSFTKLSRGEGYDFNSLKRCAIRAGVDLQNAKVRNRALRGFRNHTITKIEKLTGKVNVYDLTVDRLHNFIAGGICVHNCRAPNLQNIPTGRRVAGVRECFVPRPGHVMVSVDYETLELRTLAQVCLWLFGESRMAVALNAGLDLHCVVAAQLLGLSYDETVSRYQAGDTAAKKARDVSKVANFGLPGGMGVDAFIMNARKGYGMPISEDKAKQIRKAWLAAWPEMRQYFAYISRLTEVDDNKINQLGTARVRGRCRYTEAANTLFQGLAGSGAKHALYKVVREAYISGGSLRGLYPLAFIHDECLAEVEESRARELANRLAEVMVEGMQEYVPDVKIAASPDLMRRWTKNTEEFLPDED